MSIAATSTPDETPRLDIERFDIEPEKKTFTALMQQTILNSSRKTGDLDGLFKAFPEYKSLNSAQDEPEWWPVYQAKLTSLQEVPGFQEFNKKAK